MRLIDRNENKKWSPHGMVMVGVLVAALLYSALASGQKPEYEFYFEYRGIFGPKVQEENHWLLTNEEVLERYAAKLKSEGVAESEIARRTRLIRTEKPLLEADYWSRYYLDSRSNFNRAPNGFLMQMVEGRPPGTALD